MRVYEGSPRQQYEEALRSLGALLDQRAMREVLIAETSDGFVVQGLVPSVQNGSSRLDDPAMLRKETFLFADDDVARFVEEAFARRHQRTRHEALPGVYYQKALRVLGRYFDEQGPRDIMLFEHERSFVVRLLMGTRAGVKHVLAEFTREEMDQLIAASPELRDQAYDTPSRPRPTTPPPLPPTLAR